LCRAGAEQGLAVAAAEQEDEPLQVITQLGQAVGGVADELCQGVAQAGGVAGQQTRTTESVYRRELRPVITIGADVRDQIFPS
jgi:hypothetical protein